MILLLFVALLIVGLEACKIGWHGKWQDNLWLASGHALCAMWLAWTAFPFLWGPTIGLALASVLASYRHLEAKRQGLWYGNLLSALSSWPVELAAIAAVTAPLWGQWPQFAGACALWLAVAALCKWAIWRGPLRPAHWT